MAPLVCPSPVILDHSFPRSLQALDDVIGALGNLQRERENGKLALVASPIFPMFVSEIDWQKVKEFPPLLDIYRYLTAIFLQPSGSYIEIDTGKLPPAPHHPLPNDCVGTDLTNLWAEEVGKIKELHDQRCDGKPFIGIACHHGFSGGQTGGYSNPDTPHLPLVGLKEYEDLDSGTQWEIEPNIHNQSVPYDSAYRNLKLIGGIRNDHFEGSHLTVHFPGAPRPWVLDKNIDPVSEIHFRELPALAGFPSDYIRQTLIRGVVPREISRLS